MKMSLYLFILAFITSCGNTAEITKSSTSVTAPEAVEAEVLKTTKPQQTMIVGKFTKEDLLQGDFATWFNEGYNSFEPSTEALEIIKNNISEYEIIGLMGTWCPDSRREVPKFFKLLDEAGYDLSKLTMIGVTRNKSTPENLEAGYDLQRVPTFIFMKNGKEVNRYVEYPAKIVSGKEYKHSYLR
jgi:thiol-disulfide isomerase/thioredoxin